MQVAIAIAIAIAIASEDAYTCSWPRTQGSRAPHTVGILGGKRANASLNFA
jgi:hypothetical protein